MAVAGGSFYAGLIFSQNNKSSRFDIQGLGNSNMPPNTSFNRQTNSNSNAGEIISKDENTITIKLNNGGSKIIMLSESTQINKFSQGTAEDLEIGKNILAQGTNNSDGSITAKTIQITPIIKEAQEMQNPEQ